MKLAGFTEAAECLLGPTCSDESKESNDKCACITKPTSRYIEVQKMLPLLAVAKYI